MFNMSIYANIKVKKCRNQLRIRRAKWKSGNIEWVGSVSSPTHMELKVIKLKAAYLDDELDNEEQTECKNLGLLRW